MDEKIITLSQGSGGQEMQNLIKKFHYSNRGQWDNYDSDSATLKLDENRRLVFTTDSFIINPIFFPGGDIGHVAACGTINDLCVMGATPLGLSVAFVIEEGFLMDDLHKIVGSIDKISRELNIPVVTGDTKVLPAGKLDGIVINTSGVGIVTEDNLLTKKICNGDKIIISGGLGEHAVALLSKRFNYSTDIVTDSKPLLNELNAVRGLIKLAKDPTRGGIASILNELVQKHEMDIVLYEDKIPAKPQVRKVVEMLGINLYELACEGRFICITSNENASEVESILKQFNEDAAIIGEVIIDTVTTEIISDTMQNDITKQNKHSNNNTNTHKVIIQTFLGKRLLPMPTGIIVPRIC